MATGQTVALTPQEGTVAVDLIASIRAALAVLALRLQAGQEDTAAAAQAAQTAQAAAAAAQTDAREHWTHIGGQAPNMVTGISGNVVLHTDGLATLSDGTIWPEDVEVRGFQYRVTAVDSAPFTGHDGDTWAVWRVFRDNLQIHDIEVPLQDGGVPRVSGYIAFPSAVEVPAGSRFTLQWRPGDMLGTAGVLRAALVVVVVP